MSHQLSAISRKPFATCPWLGSEEDRKRRYQEPAGTHLCYAQKRPAAIDLEHQAYVCLSTEHTHCRFFLKPPPAPASPAPLEAAEDEVGPPPRRISWLRTALWIAVALAAVAVAFLYGRQLLYAPLPATVTPSLPATASPTVTLTPTPVPVIAVPTATLEILLPTATPTPFPGGANYALSPEAGAAGWLASDETRGNHLGDSYLYAGVFDGTIYHGIWQIDLSPLPRGATIYSAVLEITGLNGSRLGGDGVWEVRVLAREADANWSRQSFQDVHNATVQWTLLPAIEVGDLAEGMTNAFVLSAEQIKDLEQRLLDEQYAVSFRIDGPLAGENSVFAWDSGYASATQGHGPRLVLSVGPAPKTPIPTGTPPFVVVTSTPTPANVLTAEAWGRTATAVARTTGTPAATSIYQWTATPEHVVTNTPTPANDATATMIAKLVTAMAFTTGTFTPTPDYLVTATATRVLIPFEELTPTPTPPPAPPVPGVPAQLRGLVLFESSRAGDAGPWVMDGQGNGVGLLTAPWPYDVAAGREAYSPDGTRLVYAGKVGNQPAILVRPAAGGQGQTVTVFEQGAISAPAWSPTGNWIAFVASAGGGTAVWVVKPDGSGLLQLTAPENGSAGHPSFSPDGKRLAYALSGADGKRQVWSIALDGTDRRNLSNNGWDEWAPVWAK